jgi:hypothetical protein
LRSDFWLREHGFGPGDDVRHVEEYSREILVSAEQRRRERKGSLRLDDQSDARQRAQHAPQRQRIDPDDAREFVCVSRRICEVGGEVELRRDVQKLRQSKPHDHVAQPGGGRRRSIRGICGRTR